jgi:hypothetical protein
LCRRTDERTDGRRHDETNSCFSKFLRTRLKMLCITNRYTEHPPPSTGYYSVVVSC